MIVTLYTSRLVLNTLGVEDFGVYSIVAGVIVMLGFLNSAMAASTQRFLTFEIGGHNFDKLKRVFNVSKTIHLIIAVLIFVLAETIGVWFLNNFIKIPVGRINAAYWVFQFSVLAFIINVFSAPYNAVIIANEKMGFFAFVGVLDVVLKLISVYLLFVFDYDKLILYAFLIFVVSVLIRIAEGIYCTYSFLECKKNKLLWDKDLIVEMGNFAGWNLFGVAAGIGYVQGVNIVLNIFFGVTINATRGIAFQVQGAVSNLVTNFQLASSPSITKYYAKKEMENAFELVFTVSKFSFFLLLFFLVPFLMKTETVLVLWLKNLPDYTVIFVQLIMCDVLINSLSGPLHNLVQATGRVKKYQIYVSGLLLLNLPTCFIALYLGYSPEITIKISIFYSILALIIRVIILNRSIDFPIKKYFSSVVFQVIIVGIVSFVLSFFIESFLNDNLIGLLLNVILSSIFILISILIFGLNFKERIFFESKLNSILKFKKNKNN